MPAILSVGIIIISGLIGGEIAKKMKLPAVTGYILAGVFLNPGLFNVIPKSFLDNTGLITNIALSFITFSIGGTLLLSRIKRLGKGVIYITVFEAEFAFLAVIAGFLVIIPFLMHNPGSSWFATFIPFALLLGALASPTDPSATLAVVHQYKARGEVSSMIMSVAAFDDVFGIINFSLAATIAATLISHQQLSLYSSVLKPLMIIGGSVLLGAVFGFIFNILTAYIKKETEGFFIVLIFALLPICFGLATLLNADELLSTMTMGIVVVNFNVKRDKIFRVLERYTEELIFVLFFTLSGMHLNFAVLKTVLIPVFLFVAFRTAGKFLGVFTGAALAHSSLKIKKYTAAGLIPQGGIVIGLALLIKQTPEFNSLADIIISITIGATVIHELIGPVLSTMAIKKAGEI